MVYDSGSVDKKSNSCSSRPIYTHPEFDELYLKNETENQLASGQKSVTFLGNVLRRVRTSYCGSDANKSFGKSLLGFLYGFFPFIEIMRNYDVQNWLASDLVTGFTVGVMHVPQGNLAVCCLAKSLS